MRMLRAELILCVAVLAGCGSAHAPIYGARDCTVKPPGGIYATFSGEVTPATPGKAYYHVAITNSTGMQQAIDAWQGRTHANIPNGVMVCQPVDWNCGGWVWHLDPSTVLVQEAAIELCDGGAPTDQTGCQDYVNNGGRFCPWGAQLVEVRDCRTDPSCPVMSR